jgi:hypothetical protein
VPITGRYVSDDHRPLMWAVSHPGSYRAVTSVTYAVYVILPSLPRPGNGSDGGLPVNIVAGGAGSVVSQDVLISPSIIQCSYTGRAS